MFGMASLATGGMGGGGGGYSYERTDKFDGGDFAGGGDFGPVNIGSGSAAPATSGRDQLIMLATVLGLVVSVISITKWMNN